MVILVFLVFPERKAFEERLVYLVPAAHEDYRVWLDTQAYLAWLVHLDCPDLKVNQAKTVFPELLELLVIAALLVVPVSQVFLVRKERLENLVEMAEQQARESKEKQVIMVLLAFQVLVE